MAYKTLVSIGALLSVALLTAPSSSKAAGFSDDFESGMGKWTGKNGAEHTGVTVPDPLNSEHGNVLTFASMTGGGNIYSSSTISLAGPFSLSFDYLGLPNMGGTPGDLGGFLGISYNLNPMIPDVDHIWYAGTQDSYPGLVVKLIDDGAWHHHSIPLDGNSAGTFHMMAEDFLDVGGVARDIFFDNIVAVVPEPSAWSLVLGGIGAILAATARRGKIAA